MSLILICGCTRSATTYTAVLLKKLGLEVAHERLARDGTVSFELAVDESLWIPNHSQLFSSSKIFIHQVRHPLKVIKSNQFLNEKTTWKFIYKHIDAEPSEPILLRCAKYWYYWNILIENRSDWRFKIEDIDDVFYELCNRVGVKPNREVLKNIPRDIRTRMTESYGRKYLDVSWNMLEDLDKELCNKIKEKTLEYGYSL